MKIEPKAAPVNARDVNIQSQQSAQSARERAIAMLTSSSNQQQQQSQVQTESTPAEVAQAQAIANVSSPEGQKPQVESSSQESAPVEQPKTSTQTEEPISSQYAVLARKEKAYRAKVQAQEAAFKAKEAEIAKREAELQAKASTYESDYIPKQRLTEDTIQTLLEAGISYDKITEMALQQQTTPVDPQTRLTIKRLEEKLAKLEAETEGTKKSISQSQEDNYKQAVNQIKQDVKSMVSQGDDFEAIRATNSVDEVVRLIEKTYEEDGILLTNEEAAQQVEEELVERISAYAQLSKIQQKFKTPNTKASPEQPVAQSQDKQPQPAKTLTNNLTGGSKMSARERAVLAFQGKLGK